MERESISSDLNRSRSILIFMLSMWVGARQVPLTRDGSRLRGIGEFGPSTQATDNPTSMIGLCQEAQLRILDVEFGNL
jgi:hypothetical protein